MLREQRRAKRNRVLTGGYGEFVGKTLGEKRLMRMTDRSPESNRHRQFDDLVCHGARWAIRRG